jgi:hypothetical protein
MIVRSFKRVLRTCGGLGLEQFSPVRNGLGRDSGIEMRIGGPRNLAEWRPPPQAKKRLERATVASLSNGESYFQFFSLCRSQASTVFVGSTASSSTCSLIIFPDLSMRKVARLAVSMVTPWMSNF